MTRTRTSLLLTALLVVGATTAGLSGAVTSSTETTYQAQDESLADAAIDSGAVFWQGQFLRFTAGENNSSEVWSIRRIDDGQVGSLVTEVLLDQAGSAVIGTQNLEGRFVILNENNEPVVFRNGSAQRTGTVDEAAFEIAKQTLDATFEDTVVANDASADARTDLRVQSNRAGYRVYLFSDRLSASDLASVFEAAEVRNGRAVVTRELSGDTVLDANFSGVEAGPVNVSVITTDTTAQDTATVSVAEPVQGTAGLANATVVEQRGDVARFNVTLDGIDRATVVLGSADVGYKSQFTVVDRNGDGVVTVAVNTFRTGLSPDTPGIRAVGEDELTNYSLLTDPIPNPLETATYPIQVFAGQTKTGVGTLTLNERSTEGIQVLTAPEDATIRTVSQLREVATQDRDIAYDDTVIVNVEASGLYGYVQNLSDLDSNETGISMTLTRAGEINRPAERVALDQARLMIAEDSNQFFLLLDAGTLERNATYRANFTITAANPYVEEGNVVSVVQNFTVVGRDASFDKPVQVPSASGANISGTSTVAPGTELTVVAQNVDENPFIKRRTVEVDQDGTWEASFDFSDVPPGTNFTVSIEGLEATATGIVVSADGAAGQTNATETTTVAGETTTPAEETTTVAGETTAAAAVTTTAAAGTTVAEEGTGADETTTTTTEEEAVADETTTQVEETPAGNGGGMPGFGIGVALVALVVAVLVAVGRR